MGSQRRDARDTDATARRAPDAKASADPRVRRLLRGCRVPALAAALTKIGIAETAARAGAAPRTRPAPRRPPAGGVPGLGQDSPPGSSKSPPRLHKRGTFETPASFFPGFLPTSRFCPCLGMSGGRGTFWGQRRWLLISAGITRATGFSQREQSGIEELDPSFPHKIKRPIRTIPFWDKRQHLRTSRKNRESAQSASEHGSEGWPFGPQGRGTAPPGTRQGAGASQPCCCRGTWKGAST